MLETVRPVILSLGTNLGDRQEMMGAMEEGVRGMLEPPVTLSRLMETEPVGMPEGTPWFLNRLVCGGTTLKVRGLLEACLELEKSLGRRRGEGVESRTADIDILVFGARTFREPDLTVPHPRLHERRFCVEGLVELMPDSTVPGLDRTPLELRAQMSAAVARQRVRRVPTSV